MFFKNKFLMLTVFLPVLWFGLDKIFALEWVKSYTIPWRKIEIIFYESRKDLLEVYSQNLEDHISKGEKRGLILGSSRSGEFSPHAIKKVIPNIAMYNFSAPLAGPAFHYYWLEKVYEEDKNLSVVILEIDPVLLAKSSLTYTLNYSLDWDYVWTHSYFFPERLANPWKEENNRGFNWDEVETWLNKKLFFSYRYPPDPGYIKENKKQTITMVDGNPVVVTGKEYKNMFMEQALKANRTEYGAIPNQIMHHGDDKFLEKDAKNMADIHFGDKFKPSKTQIAFFKKILDFCGKNNIKLVLYWPLVSDYFRDEMDKRNLVEIYKNEIRSEMKRVEDRYSNTRFILLDPHNAKDIQCKAFVDSVHLSGACYPELFSLFGNTDFF